MKYDGIFDCYISNFAVFFNTAQNSRLAHFIRSVEQSNILYIYNFFLQQGEEQ